MIEKEKQYHWKYYTIVGILFLFIIFLWLFMGGWGKQFNSFANNGKEKKKINLRADFDNILKKSNEQFSKIAPNNDKKFDKDRLIDDIIDDVLGKTVNFEDVKVKYPDKWVKVDGSSTSTLTLLSADGEKFIFTGISASSSTDPISDWHALAKEPMLDWSWRKVKDGYVGFKKSNNLERVIGLFQASSSTVIVLERDSQEIKKAEDGLVEMLIAGLRK